MDNLWERSIPFYNIDIEVAAHIFKEYDEHVDVQDLTLIKVGCRNSNYIVKTNKGFFLLRICPLGDTSYKKEKAVSELSIAINIPRLIYISENNITERVCLIYEYINGISLQSLAEQKGKFEDSVITQVAEISAHIHSCEVKNKDKFENNYPPFLMWYDLFLDNEKVAERIGGDVTERVRKLIRDKKNDLYEIDSYMSFIHSDFRPANMLTDKDNNIWVVDWEFSGFGHSLADIGQFFRYSDCFETGQIKRFQTAYNRLAKRPLPSNWYRLSRLRELVNPLQMLGGKENLPQKYNDLKRLVLDTLEFFGF